MDNILITGGCGFVGFNLSVFLSQEFPQSQVMVFDNLKRRGSELNLSTLKDRGVKFIHGDIRNEEDFEQIKDVDLIIDASAEPSVLAGIDGGQKQLVNINLFGTSNILAFAKTKNAKVIFLSTSRIYPIKALNQIKTRIGDQRFEIETHQDLPGISSKGISENFPKDGARSFYGASKYASELLFTEYHEFCNMDTIVNRCGVIAGPHQMGKVDQGFAVLWLAKHYWKQELAYFGFNGSGKQVRDLLHVDDLCQLIKIQVDHFDVLSGKTYNVGGGLENSISLLEMTKICEEISGNSIKIGQVMEDRVADIKLYISDNSKIQKELGWKPLKSPKLIVQDIFNWINQNENELKSILG